MPVSLHERYSHVRTLLGLPHPVSFLVAIPASSTPHVDPDVIRRRAEYLQTVWPHLYARIDGAHTHRPTWIAGAKPWAGQDVVVTRELREASDDPGQVLQMESRDFRDGPGASAALDKPAWRLTLYTQRTDGEEVAGSSTESREEWRYIAFSASHVLLDGSGALRLMFALLSNDQYPAEPLPPALESTININPGFLTILPQVWTKLIRPKLPAWFQPVVDPNAPLNWPGPLAVTAGVSQEDGAPNQSMHENGVRIGQTDLPERIMLLDIPKATTAGLKAACKSKGITLHPVLKTAWIWAMFAVIDTTPRLTPLRTDGTPRAYSLLADTPRNERTPDLGHGYATGNYVSGLDFRYASPTGSEQPVAFWTTAEAVSKHLSSPATITQARQRFGALAYIPNKPNDASVPTGWEVFWEEQRSQDAPYSAAVSMSNLGYTSLLSTILPDGAEGATIHWMQPAVPWGDALAVNVIGHSEGLGITVSILDGAAVGQEDVQRMCEVFKSILARLGDSVEDYEQMTA